MLSQRSGILPPPLNPEPAVVEREWPRVLDPVELARRLPRRPQPLSHPFGPVAPRELVLYGLMSSIMGWGGLQNDTITQ